jgi:hypothetical protein
MSAVVATVAAAVLTTVVSAAANADTVTLTWGCGNPLGGGGSKEVRITITAPATANVGQTGTVHTSVSETVPYPTNIPANTYTAQMDITLGGVASGMVYTNWMANPQIPAGTPWRVENGQAQITFAQAGTVTFTPYRFLVYRNGSASYMCGGTAPVTATTQVS